MTLQAASGSSSATAQTTPSLPTPDARPGSFFQLFVALIAGSIAILPVWAMWASVSRADVEDVIIRLNSPDDAFVYVRAGVDGVFEAAPNAPLAHNSIVRAGEPLGSVQTPNTRRALLQADIEQLTLRIDDLQHQRLGLFSASPTEASGESGAVQREHRDIAQKIAELEAQRVLHEYELRLSKQVVVPAMNAPAGRVHGGVPASKNIKEGDMIVPIWPLGERLQVEVEGPQSVVLPLVEKPFINVHVYTTCTSGTGQRKTARLTLPATPDPATLTTYVHEREGQESEIWAKLQCHPQRYEPQRSEHEVELFPGLVGTLAAQPVLRSTKGTGKE